MYHIRHILCTIICMCTCFHVTATCGNNIFDNFSYKILEKFNYCRDNNVVYADTNNLKDTALFISFHKHIMFPISHAFSKYDKSKKRKETTSYGE